MINNNNDENQPLNPGPPNHVDQMNNNNLI
jgi:hypothetical protein